MNPASTIRSVLQELGVQARYIIHGENKRGTPRNFVVSVGRQTVSGSTVRSAIRALRRTFSAQSNQKSPRP